MLFVCRYEQVLCSLLDWTFLVSVNYFVEPWRVYKSRLIPFQDYCLERQIVLCSAVLLILNLRNTIAYSKKNKKREQQNYTEAHSDDSLTQPIARRVPKPTAHIGMLCT